MEDTIKEDWLNELNLSNKQKVAGVLFLISKISCIATIPLTFTSIFSKQAYFLSWILISIAAVSLLLCIGVCLIDMRENQEEKIRKLLRNPEARRLIEKEMAGSVNKE